MKDSQLIKLLKTFTPKEIKKFSEFISSPYFNKNKNVIKLYEILRKDYPDFDKLSKEHVFEKIFPGKDYKDNNLRILIHQLYENAKEYITHKRFTDIIYNYRYKEVLIYDLYERELYDESGKEIDKAILDINKFDYQDAEFFKYKFIMEYEKLYFLQKKYQDKYEKYFTKSNIETPFVNLANYFLIKVLTFLCFILNTKILYKLDIDTSFFEKLIACYDIESLSNVPLIQIYYNMVMALKNKDEKYFYNIKDLLLENEKQISLARQCDIYVNLENYCRRKIRAGETKFKREFFDILKMDLEKKIYKVDPYISQNFYKNILQNAAELKEFEWAESFLETYMQELRSDYQDTVYGFCKAYLEAEKNNYEKALEYLSKIQTDELYLKIDVKLLQARLYYELNEYDVLNSAIDTTRHFFKSNKFIAENRRIQFSTFIKFLSALNNTRLKKDEYKINELKESIHKTEDLQWKDWFVKKVEELEAT
ncbi:MAG: hypothetical protein ISS16_11735 [Ignavibacteria bacterium]|nr:hypothetical protein [Ignavibacteria bacterium]